MMRSLKVLVLTVLCLCVAVLCCAGLAEASQAVIDHETEWAELYGATLDAAKEAKNITKQCKVKVSEGKTEKMLNGSVGNGWSYTHDDAWIGIALPKDVEAGALRVEFRFEPKGFELIEYDQDQNVIRSRTQENTFPSIYTIMPLLSETRYIRLNMTAKDQVVLNLVVYSAGLLPANVQTWLPPEEKVDMMVFSTHQDDEVIFLGGTIPYSDVVCGRPTITVYMTNCTRNRRREALECLWEMGTRHYPEFINLEDKRVSSIEEGVKLWGGKDNILKEMVQRIRRYKPEVIVTQDLNGEYGHNQHKIMARAMKYAIEAAADETQYPDSYKMYGAWQVKKLYLHLYEENQIRMDWKTPQPALGGLTLLKVAQNGMEKHASQTKYYSVKDSGQYDNALFGLALTTVGEDVQKNDFFENIPEDASERYLETVQLTIQPILTATPEPVEKTETDQSLDLDDEPDLTDTEVIEDVENDVPETEEEDTEIVAAQTLQPTAPSEPVHEKNGSGLGGIALIAAGVLVAGAGGWMAYDRLLRSRHHRRRRR